MRLLDDLAAAPSGARLALLLRHGARPPVLSPRDFLDMALTAQGEQEAQELGRRLAASGFGLLAHHSPVLRCAQTARAMVRGAEAEGRPARVAGQLAALGPTYVHDPMWALPQYLSGGQSFIRRWFDGQLPPERIAPRREAARMQLSGLLAAWQAQETDTLSVFVTHDWNILAVREEVLGIRFEDAGWIGYLDGALLSAANGTVRLHHRGVEAPVTNELLRP